MTPTDPLFAYRHANHYLESLLFLESDRRQSRPGPGVPAASSNDATPIRPVGAGYAGLARCRRLLDFLGNPERSLQFVHVTGTSGKGSVVTQLHAVLRRAGLSAGSYLSPHVTTPLERILIDDRVMPPDRFVAEVDRLKPFLEAEYRDGPFGLPSYHEVMFGIALSGFASAGVRLAVLEVGIGGTLDSTNVIPAPRVAVITDVGLDHTELLGPDVASIARDKAGILKPGSVAITGTRPPDAWQEIARWAEQERVPLWSLDRELTVSRAGKTSAVAWSGNGSSSETSPVAGRGNGRDRNAIGVTRSASGSSGQTIGVTWPGGGIDGLEPGMPGEHQVRNVALTAGIVALLRQQGFQIPDEAVRAGVREAFLPGRLEAIELSADRVLVLDIAHNFDKVEGLAATWEVRYGRGGAAVVAISSDKDADGILSSLGRVFSELVVTRPLTVPRKMWTPLELERRAHALGFPVVLKLDPVDALRAAWRRGRGRVAVTGSTYLVGELRRLFEPEETVIANGRSRRLEPSQVQAWFDMETG